ncbi:MAG: porin family protein [Bacteroidetes bacterium]|nr:porin family protein [Bacteroidota bacterium]MCL5738151.1 porin family protein [Bacteroidota bacterium]
MKILFRVLSVFTFLAFIGATALAQDLTLKGRSVLELNMGVWGGSKVSNTIGTTGIQSTANTSSFAAGILYAYGLQEGVAVTLSAGVLTAGASSNVGIYGINQQASSVIPLLLGIRYYVPSPEPDARIRPFISVAVGSYIAFEASNSVGMTVLQESHTESAFGGRAGVGVDLYVNNHFKFVANAGYNLMTDFSTPVAARMNYNGGEFSLGVGFAF